MAPTATSLDPAHLRPTDHYPIISADCHAGASHAVYREYLEARYLEDFDAWRAKYRNPYKDLRATDDRIRNWDNEKRNGDEERDHIVGEVIFPNTVPPFFPSFVLFAPQPTPDTYEHRLAGIRAHNRWLVDWCGEFPERRAGIGQIFLNDVDDAIEDVHWIKQHGLRGGVLLPSLPPDVTWLPPITDRHYDRLWEVCADLGVVVNTHSGTGSPNYGNRPGAALLQTLEIPFYSQRPLVHLLLSGVFERHPKLQYCLTELGGAWVVPMLEQLDNLIERIRSGASGEMRYTADDMPLTMTATEMFHQNCHLGVSFAGPADVAARAQLGVGAIMWGSDYPHDEGSYPYSLERIRHAFHDVDPNETFAMLTGNAAELYGFEIEKLVPLANRVGPTVAEVQTPLDPETAAKIPRRV
jgi:predicted TIM-barrel fold metal-dependent hydrolase